MDEKDAIYNQAILFVADTAAPRNSWMLVKVLETFPDHKGLGRSAKIQTKLSVIIRPVTKLCLLIEM